jgi:putative phosphoribosyl transferase
MFRDRAEAAFLLAHHLKPLKISNGIVMAIPRGGVPIGSIIAHQLDLPLDLAMSKKIGHPGNPEFAIGSVTLDDLVLDGDAARLPQAFISAEVRKIREDILKRYNRFTKGNKPPSVEGRDVILVDDGLATGNTMFASIQSLRKQKPKSIIVAVPVSSVAAAAKIKAVADQFVCLEVSKTFYGVGESYKDFSEVPDQMVIDLLAQTNPEAVSAQYKYSF